MWIFVFLGVAAAGCLLLLGFFVGMLVERWMAKGSQPPGESEE